MNAAGRVLRGEEQERGGHWFRQLFVYGVSAGGTMIGNLALAFVLVRLLPADEYAGLVLVKVSLLLVTSLAGLGLSQAVVRWVGGGREPGVVLGTALMGAALQAIPAALVFVGLLVVFAHRVGLTWNNALLLSAAG